MTPHDQPQHASAQGSGRQHRGRPDHGAPSHCENCGAALHGAFCHHCGQSIHNPVRHAGHAVEEVFESFWHLDGRVFRTLRDLLSPGLTAMQYLAGHRQRYLPPLRLFVIMSLLAFFVGKLTIHVDPDPDAVEVGADTTAITDSQSVEEVRAQRDRLLAEIKATRLKQGDLLPGVDAALIAAQVQIEGEAANRIGELTAAGQPPVAGTGEVSSPSPVQAGGRGKSKGALFSIRNEAWDPAVNPVRIGWLPGFANDYLNRKLAHGQDNIQRMEGRADLWFQAFMGSLPSALFLLVPVFALMLKLAYVFKRRLYLEHLVVALYSHAFLLMALTAIFLSMAVADWAGAHAVWLGVITKLVIAALMIWMPVYLLLMQKRVYVQGWTMTLIKYAVLGTCTYSCWCLPPRPCCWRRW